MKKILSDKHSEEKHLKVQSGFRGEFFSDSVFRRIFLTCVCVLCPVSVSCVLCSVFINCVLKDCFFFMK